MGTRSVRISRSSALLSRQIAALVAALLTACAHSPDPAPGPAENAIPSGSPSPTPASSGPSAHLAPARSAEAVAVEAAGPRALAAAFLSNPELQHVTLSPDGRRLAAVDGHGRVDRLVVFDLEANGGRLGEPREILVEERGDRGFRASRRILTLGWASDDMLVYSIETALRSPEDGIPRSPDNSMTSRQRGIGSRARKTRLYSANLDGRFRYLGNRWQDGPYSQYQHDVIDLLPGDPHHVLIDYEGKAVRVDVRNGGRLTLEHERSLDSRWFSDHTGTIRAAQSSPHAWDRQVALHARVSARDPWTTLLRYDAYVQPGFGFAGFAADPGKLYVYSDRESDRTALHEYDLVARKLGARIAPEATAGSDVVGLVQSGVDDSLLAIEHCAAQCGWTYLDRNFERRWAKIEATFPGRSVNVLGRSRADERWLIQASSDRSAPEIAWAELATGRVVKLYDAYPALAGRSLAPMRDVRYRTRDGEVVEGYLTRPIGATGAGPVVVMPHDGPDRRDAWGFHAVVQYLVARGYSVFQPNYRGSSGYGRRFEQAGHGQWGGLILRDVIDGARALVAGGIADRERIAIYGHGFGGFLALQALVEAPELFAAGASFGAVTDIPLMLADDRRFRRRAAIDEKVVVPASGDEEALAAVSPVNGVAAIRVPVLIGHGSENPRYHEKHADAMIAALRRAGKPVESLRYEGDTDVFLDDSHRIDFYSRLGDFLDRHLSGRDLAQRSATATGRAPRSLP